MSEILHTYGTSSFLMTHLYDMYMDPHPWNVEISVDTEENSWNIQANLVGLCLNSLMERRK